jgi:hypothetical protein
MDLLFEQIIRICGISYDVSLNEEAVILTYKNNIQRYCGTPPQCTQGFCQLIEDIVCNPVELSIDSDGIWLWQGRWGVTRLEMQQNREMQGWVVVFDQIIQTLQTREDVFEQNIQNPLRRRSVYMNKLKPLFQNLMDCNRNWRLQALKSTLIVLATVCDEHPSAQQGVCTTIQVASQHVIRVSMLCETRPCWSQTEMMEILQKCAPRGTAALMITQD